MPFNPNAGFGPVTGTSWKIQLFFNAGGWGWNEEYWFNQAYFGFSDWANSLPSLATARKACLHSLASLVGFRVSQVDQTGKTVATQLLSSIQLGCGPGTDKDSNGMADIGDGPLLAIVDRAGTHRRSFILRGIPFYADVWNPQAAPTVYPQPFQGNLNNFISFLLIPNANNANWNTVVPLIRGRSFDPTVTLPVPITGISLAADGCHVNLDVTSLSGFSTTQAYHVHGLRGQNVKGVSGDGLALALNPGLINSFTWSRKPCCCGTPTLTTTKAYVYGIVYGMYPWYGCNVSRTVHRNTGRPFFGTRGRRPGCRC